MFASVEALITVSLRVLCECKFVECWLQLLIEGEAFSNRGHLPGRVHVSPLVAPCRSASGPDPLAALSNPNNHILVRSTLYYKTSQVPDAGILAFELFHSFFGCLHKLHVRVSSQCEPIYSFLGEESHLPRGNKFRIRTINKHFLGCFCLFISGEFGGYYPMEKLPLA